MSETAADFGKVAKIPPMRTIRRAIRETALRLVEPIIPCPSRVERFMLRDLLWNIYTPNHLDNTGRRFSPDLRLFTLSNRYCFSCGTSELEVSFI